jgi:hypothetical protein
MDATQFDNMAKALRSLTTRRLTLGALLGGALGLPGLADAEAAKSGTCKPKCEECERCKKGRCRKTKHGKKRCKRGTCQPRADGTTCQLNAVCSGGSCTCVNGACAIDVPGVACCPPSSALPCTFAAAGSPVFLDPTTCTFVGACPGGTTVCVGAPGTSQACCPSGTTCDTGTGACLR